MNTIRVTAPLNQVKYEQQAVRSPIRNLKIGVEHPKRWERVGAHHCVRTLAARHSQPEILSPVRNAA
jgi:hypothetical protein